MGHKKNPLEERLSMLESDFKYKCLLDIDSNAELSMEAIIHIAWLRLRNWLGSGLRLNLGAEAKSQTERGITLPALITNESRSLMRASPGITRQSIFTSTKSPKLESPRISDDLRNNSKRRFAQDDSAHDSKKRKTAHGSLPGTQQDWPSGSPQTWSPPRTRKRAGSNESIPRLPSVEELLSASRAQTVVKTPELCSIDVHEREAHSFWRLRTPLPSPGLLPSGSGHTPPWKRNGPKPSTIPDLSLSSPPFRAVDEQPTRYHHHQLPPLVSNLGSQVTQHYPAQNSLSCQSPTFEDGIRLPPIMSTSAQTDITDGDSLVLPSPLDIVASGDAKCNSPSITGHRKKPDHILPSTPLIRTLDDGTQFIVVGGPNYPISFELFSGTETEAASSDKENKLELKK